MATKEEKLKALEKLFENIKEELRRQYHWILENRGHIPLLWHLRIPVFIIDITSSFDEFYSNLKKVYTKMLGRQKNPKNPVFREGVPCYCGYPRTVHLIPKDGLSDSSSTIMYSYGCPLALLASYTISQAPYQVYLVQKPEEIEKLPKKEQDKLRIVTLETSKGVYVLLIVRTYISLKTLKKLDAIPLLPKPDAGFTKNYSPMFRITL